MAKKKKAEVQLAAEVQELPPIEGMDISGLQADILKSVQPDASVQRVAIVGATSPTGWRNDTSGKRCELNQLDLDAAASVLGEIEERSEITPGDILAVMNGKDKATESVPAPAATPGVGGGFKLDTGKPRWDLAPLDAFECMIKIQTWAVDTKIRGDRAYPERNWERGMKWSRVFSAMMRHAMKWWLGKLGIPGHSVIDDESGMSHAWHFFTCAGFLVTYELRGMTDFDDRPGNVAEKAK